jgi:N-acetylmuramoyl-L-alanine amidase
MLSAAYYFLQVVFCSAVMMGYYWLVLRDKKFHQYNRFYLISVLLLSWIIPLIKIQFTKPVNSGAQVINFLSIVADNNAEIDANLAKNSYQFTWEGFVVATYFLIATLMLVVLIVGLIRLYILLKKHSCKSVGDVYLILTQVKGTPFSFFRYIFWHEAIDLRSDTGKKMLEHELTHVQQKHSIDKVLIQMVLVAGWFNPFFWLLKKEMEMIHEFIADNKSVQNGDSASLAQLLLMAAYPQQQFLLTTPFFFSPIKRRLQMITNHKNPRFSYLRRLVILPILALVVVLVAFRKKDTELSLHQSIQFNKTYTVVIDAGHGGKDRGAVSSTSKVSEAELSLLLAKAVKEANTNPNIKIVLTRETDVFNTVQEKADFANAHKADLFISLHCNNASKVLVDGKKMDNSSKGIEIYIADKTNANDYIANATLANDLGNAIKNVNTNLLGIKSRNTGIWVLQAVKCPSTLIETGFITNQEDLKLLLDVSYQKRFATAILEGVQYYLYNLENDKIGKRVDVLQDNNNDVTVIESPHLKEEIKKLFIKDTSTPRIKIYGPITPIGKLAVIYLDGVKIDTIAFHKLNPDIMARVDVWKGEEAIKKFGKEGENGVVLITSKPKVTDIKLERVELSSNKEVEIKTVQLIDPKVIYYIDGVKSDSATMHQLDPKTIESVNILKRESAILKYGPDASNGVVEVKLKKQVPQ